jgi:endonuclease/exonuclease/phosphatase family metal-dependent hydrolase
MTMSFARAASVLAVLCVLCACAGRDDANGPVLPATELPSTTVGLAYEVNLTATGGAPPLRYTVGEVPPGFSFYSGTALFTGPAATAGDYTLAVRVTDANGAQDSRTYAFRVYAAPSIIGTSLPPATTGQAYEFELSSTGGQLPVRWTLADGALPPGLTLMAGGSLSGTPSAPGTYTFTVRLQDGNNAQATRPFTLEVRNATAAFLLDVGNWNIEWFGSTSNGPADEQLQLTNVRTVMQEAALDFWAVEEIVSVTHFNALKQGLPGYAGFVANDPGVTSGSFYYSDDEQKLAVLYKSSVVQVLRAEVILGAYNFEFAGRPPLRVDLRVTRNGASVDLVAIVLHMKAFASTSDYDQRKAAGEALKQYLETALANARVLVLGDWNDDVDVSIVRDPSNTSVYLPSPYQNYVDQPEEYTFLTQPLSLKGEGSTVGRTNIIDHQLVTNELADSYVSNSTRVVIPAIPNYSTTTSDHYPVVSRFDFGHVVSPGP